MAKRPTHRLCSGCDRDLRFNTQNFYRNANNAHGLGTQCKRCVAKYQRNYQHRHPDKLRDRLLRRRYNISEKDYARMLMEQGGGCAICGGEGADAHLSVDHCHESGLIRGLLCRPCNRGLGHFRDDLKLIERAKDYLMESKRSLAVAS